MWTNGAKIVRSRRSFVKERAIWKDHTKGFAILSARTATTTKIAITEKSEVRTRGIINPTQ